MRAVADATVVHAKDGLPDNIPRTAAGFETAVPVTMETVAGNSVVLDLGDGQYAYYAYLKPGSVRHDRSQYRSPIEAKRAVGDSRWIKISLALTNASIATFCTSFAASICMPGARPVQWLAS